MRYTFFFQMDGIHVILNLFNYKAYHMFSTCRERERENFKYHLTKQIAFIFDDMLVKYLVVIQELIKK